MNVFTCWRATVLTLGEIMFKKIIPTFYTVVLLSSFQTVVLWATQNELCPQVLCCQTSDWLDQLLDPCSVSKIFADRLAFGSSLSFFLYHEKQTFQYYQPTPPHPIPLGCLSETLKPLSLMPYLPIPKIIRLCIKNGLSIP